MAYTKGSALVCAAVSGTPEAWLCLPYQNLQTGLSRCTARVETSEIEHGRVHDRAAVFLPST